MGIAMQQWGNTFNYVTSSYGAIYDFPHARIKTHCYFIKDI